MNLSDKGKAFIIDYEKRAPRAYRDSGGAWTIGIGHLITSEEERTGVIKIGDQKISWRAPKLSDEQMDTLFAQDLVARERVLNVMLTREPNQQQYDAMFSLFYNIGAGAFRTSSVRRKFIAGSDAGAANAFRLWNKVKGRINAGLIKRREQERAMFLRGDYTSEH